MRLPFRPMIIVLAIVIHAGSASAQPGDRAAEDISSNVRSFHAGLMAKINPVVRTWIASQSRVALESKATSEAIAASLRSAIRTRFKGQNIGPDDEGILIALILAGAAIDNHDAVDKLRNRKSETSKLRQQLDALESDLRAARGPSAGLKATDRCAVCTDINRRIDAILIARRNVPAASKLDFKHIETVADLTAAMDNLQSQKDSISAMGEQDMLLLQQTMEKKEQVESMMSNVMKKGSETMTTIISNLK